jgi:hypothetical protein
MHSSFSYDLYAFCYMHSSFTYDLYAFFRRSQFLRMSGAQRASDTNTQKPQLNASVLVKVEEITKPVPTLV